MLSTVHLSSWSKARLGWLGYSDHDLLQWESYHHVGTVEALPTLGYGNLVPRFKAREWLEAFLHWMWPWVHTKKVTTFYLLETRSADGRYSRYDEGIPGDGLVVYQVNLTLTATQEFIRVNVVENKRDLVSPTWLTTGEDYLLPGADGLIRISAIDNRYDQTTFIVDTEVKYPLTGSDPIIAALYPIPYRLNSSTGPSSLDVGQVPDLDLHAFATDGKHIGINYTTGEYEVQIPCAITSGDMFEGTEWIIVPENAEVHFVVSSKDTAEFLELSQSALEDENGLYLLEISYLNENNYYSSPTVGQVILPGEELFHSFDLTQNPDGTYSVEAKQGMDLLSLEAWHTVIDNIPDNVFIKNPSQRKQALREKFEEVFEELEEAEEEMGENEFDDAKEHYQEAAEKLINDILKKLDADGQADWVKRPALVNEINALVSILEHEMNRLAQ